MKKRYFKYVTIEQEIVQGFVAKHPTLAKFVNPGDPFPCRISRKPYSGLVHTIVSQDLDSEQISIQWNQLNDFCRTIKPKKLWKLPEETLTKIVGPLKAKILRAITKDVNDWIIDFYLLEKDSEENIIKKLSIYDGLTINTIKTFLIFGLFKQNVLCDQDPDFIKGLKIFLNKENIEQQDIDNIKMEYNGQLTLFSLCMWKIRNERAK